LWRVSPTSVPICRFSGKLPSRFQTGRRPLSLNRLVEIKPIPLTTLGIIAAGIGALVPRARRQLYLPC
jgi:hypothetical protein